MHVQMKLYAWKTQQPSQMTWYSIPHVEHDQLKVQQRVTMY